MNVSWENLGQQNEKNALVFLKAANLSDSIVETDSDKIRGSLLGCYENFSSSQLIQAKVFELLAVILRKSKKRVFPDENLVLVLHYAKNMMSEWISSSDVTVNVLKFLVVLFEKERPGAVDEDLIAQCGEILKTHSHSVPVQKICLTFLCGVTRYCDVESFSEQSIADLAQPVVETIRSSKDDLDVLIKALVVLTFLFERVPERLHAVSMDALDAVSTCLQQHSGTPAFAAMAVSLLQLCAMDDTHFIILSSSEKGFGLYCDLCLKFMENNDVSSMLSCVLLLKRASSEKIRELTINSIPGLKKKVISAVGQVRDTAAASSIEASPEGAEILRQVVFACDGVLGALDPQYCPDGGLDQSYTSKGSRGALHRSSSAVNDGPADKGPPKILPRSNSAPSYAAPKPPAAEHSEPVTSVSLLSHAGALPVNSKKMKAKRRIRTKPDSEDADNASTTSDLSSTSRSLSGDQEGWPKSPASQKSPLSVKRTSFSFTELMQEEAKKMLEDPLESKAELNSNGGRDAERSSLDDDHEEALPPLPYKKSPGNVPRLDISPPPTDVAALEGCTPPDSAKLPSTFAALPRSPKKDPLLDKMKSFHTAISASNTPRSDQYTPRSTPGILRSKSTSDEALISSVQYKEQITELQSSLDDMKTINRELEILNEDSARAAEAAAKERDALSAQLAELQRAASAQPQGAGAVSSGELEEVMRERSAALEQCAALRSQLEAAQTAAAVQAEGHAVEADSLTRERDEARADLAAAHAAQADGKTQASDFQEQCRQLQVELDRAKEAAARAEERAAAEREALARERDRALAEVCTLRASLEQGMSAEEASSQAAERDIEALKGKNAELQASVQQLQASLDDAQAAAAEKDAARVTEIAALQRSCEDSTARAELLQQQLDKSAAKDEELLASKKLVAQLQALSAKAQEQASVAVLRVEELHSVLMEATAKVAALSEEKNKLAEDLEAALKREDALVQEQEDLIAAYREEGDADGDMSVVLISDEGDKIVVPLGDAAMQGEELVDAGEPSPAADPADEQELEQQQPEDFNDDYGNGYGDEFDEGAVDESAYYNDQSTRSNKRRKTPAESAAQGIKLALKYLGAAPASDDAAEDADFLALIEDLAVLIQQYFQAMLQCPTSDPTKSINHTLRSNALCAALCAPRLGLVDSKKLMRSDVEIAIRRQKGVRLFTVYGVAFTLILCIHKKHKLDINDNDPPTLLFRLIEMLSAYLEKEDENENLWIHSSINQRQGLSSPSRMKNSGNIEEDEVEEDQFTSDDLMAASRLLHKETKSLQSIFECYPSFASTSRSTKVAKNVGAVQGRSLDTVILIAKDFGICPSLLDRTGCINIIGQEIRRSQNDPDWVFPAGDILVSFSQFEIFLMNVALKNKNFGPSNGFVTATQKLAGLLWWMDNSGGKERLRDKDRNFKVCPFRVHGLIPTLKAAPKGEDFWLEK